MARVKNFLHNFCYFIHKTVLTDVINYISQYLGITWISTNNIQFPIGIQGTYRDYICGSEIPFSNKLHTVPSDSLSRSRSMVTSCRFINIWNILFLFKNSIFLCCLNIHMFVLICISYCRSVNLYWKLIVSSLGLLSVPDIWSFEPKKNHNF